MKYFAAYVFLAHLMVFALNSLADETPLISQGHTMIHGGPAHFNKASVDTINLMAAANDPTNNSTSRDGGAEPYFRGDFENDQGVPDWNGWTHYDVRQPTTTHWNVSTYNQPDPTNHAAWCGDINLPSCGGDDPAGGYGNAWRDILEFRHPVPDPGISTTVTVNATLIYDTEPGYDYVHLSYRDLGLDFQDIQTWDGAGTVVVDESVTYLPQEYYEGTDIAVYFRFRSDGGWSDEDCSFTSAGGCQVDDINVHVSQSGYEADFFEDFEHDGVVDDFGIWNVAYPVGVGDFSKIWTNLDDVDPCSTNRTPQVAFIDDGVVVPGTGGSQCVNWCYGPGGYIVTTTGGLAGNTETIYNAIESPVMAWPEPKSGTDPDDGGIILAFDVYRHEDLSSDAPGIYYTWGVRSADTDGSAGEVQDITQQPWVDRNIYYHGGPEYFRFHEQVADLMNPGRDEVQVQLCVLEQWWIWDWHGNDGYPAPYFDNVTVKIYSHKGPSMSARDVDLAQDGFPDSGSIDIEDLGSHSVRFDMAANISPWGHYRNDPGDTLVVTIATVRTGAELDGDPQLHYKLAPNPVFDPYRSANLPDEGSVEGWLVTAGPGSWKYAFDLPDTGFLFPGDVLHYYFTATDAIGGEGGSDPQTTIMPADTTGFSAGLGDPMGYDPAFVVRALPSICPDQEGGFLQPGILFIHDSANGDRETEWYSALNNLGLLVGNDYDVFYVNGPRSNVGNGIGGRADHVLLQDYEDILYTSGDLAGRTIINGLGYPYRGDDLGTLTSWLDTGGKDLFLTGDNLVNDLSSYESGAEGLVFLTNYMGVSRETKDVRPEIENQTTPKVKAIPGNPVFNGDLQTWIAYGSCPKMNTFDGVLAAGTGQRLAEFDSPGGGEYPFSAATLNILANGSRLISMPVGLKYVYTDPAGGGHALPDRARLLKDVLQYFDVAGDPQNVTGTDLPGISFKTSNFPNPFNPSTTIMYSMPKPGHLLLNVYNVRGQLVKTLINGNRPAGADQAVVWDGTDAQGASVASGVYFYEARTGGEVKIGKTVLLK